MPTCIPRAEPGELYEMHRGELSCTCWCICFMPFGIVDRFCLGTGAERMDGGKRREGSTSLTRPVHEMLSLREIPSTLCKGASLCEVFFDFHDDCEYEREAFFYSALPRSQASPAKSRNRRSLPNLATAVDHARVSTWMKSRRRRSSAISCFSFWKLSVPVARVRGPGGE